MLEEFKKFIMKGNLIEIAVGLILALKFTDVVNAFVDGIISPIIGAVFGAPSFKDKVLEIGDGKLLYGVFIDALIAFIITGFVLFLIVKAYNKAKDLRAQGPEAADEVPDDIALLREIRDELRARPGM
jgi:large conductance mechanosensitive channel